MHTDRMWLFVHSTLCWFYFRGGKKEDQQPQLSCWMKLCRRPPAHHQGNKRVFLLFGKAAAGVPTWQKSNAALSGWGSEAAVLLGPTDGGAVGYGSSRLLQPIILSICGGTESCVCVGGGGSHLVHTRFSLTDRRVKSEPLPVQGISAGKIFKVKFGFRQSD